MTLNSTDTTAETAGVPASEAQVVCVAIHGRYGAPDAMMEHLVRHLSAPHVHYLMPRSAGEGWYAAPTAAPLKDITKAEIAAALDQVKADIDATLAKAPPHAKLVIGGFSQGACLSLEFAAAFGKRCEALFALTGCRVGAAGNPRKIQDLDGLPAYVTTGSRDPFIRLPEFSETMHCLAEAGARLRSDVFPRSDHVMSPPEIATVDRLLRCVCAGDPLFANSAV